MADPTLYTVSYSFTGFQNNAPSTPLPAPALDNELLDIATSIASIVSAIKDVRRSDGALPNGIVTYDSLTLALQLMLDPTNAELVAGAVAAAEAAAASAGGSSTSAAASAAAALTQALAAAASAASVDLTLYLPKNGNLAGLGSTATARANLGIGSSASFNVGTTPLDVVQLGSDGILPPVNGSQLTGIDVLPVGAVVMVPGNVAIAGTVKLNGSLLSRATYPRLWTYSQFCGNIQTEAGWTAATAAFSTGDLATTFRVPDFRGLFFRSLDDGRGVDTGRNIGIVQLDALKDHTHTYQAPANTATATGATSGSALNAGGGTTTVSSGANIGALETRPVNAPLLACIKY